MRLLHFFDRGPAHRWGGLPLCGILSDFKGQVNTLEGGVRREGGRGVSISSYEQRITERTHIWMIVSFLHHCLWSVHALGCEAQIVPGDLKPAKSGLPPGEAAWPVIGINEGASADTQPPAGGTHGKVLLFQTILPLPPSASHVPVFLRMFWTVQENHRVV